MSSDSTKAKSSANSPSLLILSFSVMWGGLAAALYALNQTGWQPEWTWLLTIGIILFLVPLGTINIPGVKAQLVLGDVVTFSCAALFGPELAILAALIDGAVTSLRITKTRLKFFYNTATCAVSMAGAALMTKALYPAFGTVTGAFTEVLLAMAVFTAGYFLLSTGLIAAFIAVSKRISCLTFWRENLLWTSISYLFSGVGAIGAYLLADWVGYSIFFVLVAVMLLVHLFYRTYFQKVEVAQKQAENLELINFQTIEAMISAINAIGYGVKLNVRRVEHLTLVLGRSAGCTEDELKALRLAALLHDVGNIAVPQQILEKPSSLTPDEYEHIKLHAQIGAQLVEAIQFPYPVAEIIRHHHERFDGSGYPAGLRGKAIPLGARVLAIVDCYNSLTLDRPYRPRLSREASLRIMQDQTARAFDPFLLTSFMQIVAEADEQAAKAEAENMKFAEVQETIARQRRFWQVA